MATRAEAKKNIADNFKRIQEEPVAALEKYKFAHLFCEETSSIAPATMLYHIVSVDHLVETYQNKAFRFSSINRWRNRFDENEGFLFNLKFRNREGGMETCQNFLRNVYAMSWTDAGECAEMWKKYGSNSGRGLGVRIGVRAYDIVCALYESMRDIKDAHQRDIKDAHQTERERVIFETFRLDKVVYTTRQILQDAYRHVRCIEELAFGESDFLDNFVVKEKSFSFEHEVRAFAEVTDDIARKSKNVNRVKVGEWLNVPFDVEKIRSVVINPFANAAEAACAVIKLHENGIPLQTIKASEINV